jgi:hypothetical protein
VLPLHVRELAAIPDRHCRLTPGHVDRVETGRYVVVRGGWWATVCGLRLAADAVEETVREVRALTAGRNALWRLDPAAQPPDLAARLQALGFVTPENGVRELAALAIATAPDAEPAETRRVDTLEDYVTAVELRWDAFGKADTAREAERASLEETFHALRASEAVLDFLAFADGRPAATAGAVLTDRGFLLVGGATAAWARGRGLYRGLVRARWDEAVRRGTPALVVQANPATSAPILTRLGFEEVCRVEQLADPAERV